MDLRGTQSLEQADFGITTDHKNKHYFMFLVDLNATTNTS